MFLILGPACVEGDVMGCGVRFPDRIRSEGEIIPRGIGEVVCGEMVCF